VSDPQQKNPSPQLVKACERRFFANIALQLVPLRDPRRVVPPGRERDMWVIASQDARLFSERLSDDPHATRWRQSAVEGRHRGADRFLPPLGDRRMAPLPRVGVVSGVRRHHQGPFGAKYVFERQNHGDRSATDPTQRAERSVHEENHTGFDAQRHQVGLQRRNGHRTSLRSCNHIALRHLSLSSHLVESAIDMTCLTSQPRPLAAPSLSQRLRLMPSALVSRNSAAPHPTSQRHGNRKGYSHAAGASVVTRSVKSETSLKVARRVHRARRAVQSVSRRALKLQRSRVIPLRKAEVQQHRITLVWIAGETVAGRRATCSATTQGATSGYSLQVAPEATRRTSTLWSCPRSCELRNYGMRPRNSQVGRRQYPAVSQVVRFESRALGDASQHARTDFIPIVEGKYVVRLPCPSKDTMGSLRLAFD